MIDVELIDEFIPFIHPNQYVDYCKENPAVIKATELYKKSDNFFDIVEAIYGFVIENITYDYDQAETVEFGYIPDLKQIIERGSGICFDMAALTVAMLRSQGIPAKLVFGNYSDPENGILYHAWVSVFSEHDGKIGENIFFTGGTWNILDPSLSSRLCLSSSINLVGDGSAHQAMYYY